MTETDFWDERSSTYTNPHPITASMIEDAENQLGFRLPGSYLELLKTRNGGAPNRTWFPLDSQARTADEHFRIRAILGLGGEWGIDSARLGNEAMIREWGYPNVGVVVCECISGGHDTVMLDYRECGSQGEPRVIYVLAAEGEHCVSVVADDFAAFLEGLVDDTAFEQVQADTDVDIYKLSREVAMRAVESSMLCGRSPTSASDLCLDLIFWLHTNALTVRGADHLVEAFPKVLAGFGAGGQSNWNESLLEEWLERRLQAGLIVESKNGIRPTANLIESAKDRVLRRGGLDA